MKKLTLTALLSLFTSLGFSQALVSFVNSASTPVVGGSTISSVVPVTSAFQVHMALYYSIAASAPIIDPMTSLSGWQLATKFSPTSTATNTVGLPVAGRFSAGVQVLSNAPAASTPWVFVVAWAGNYPDFETARDAMNLGNLPIGLGWTPNAWQQPSGGSDNPEVPPALPQAMVLGPSGFNGLTIVPLVIPEPSSVALVAVGATALAWFRRKR